MIPWTLHHDLEGQPFVRAWCCGLELVATPLVWKVAGWGLGAANSLEDGQARATQRLIDTLTTLLSHPMLWWSIDEEGSLGGQLGAIQFRVDPSGGWRTSQGQAGQAASVAAAQTAVETEVRTLLREQLAPLREMLSAQEAA